MSAPRVVAVLCSPFVVLYAFSQLGLWAIPFAAVMWWLLSREVRDLERSLAEITKDPPP